MAIEGQGADAGASGAADLLTGVAGAAAGGEGGAGGAGGEGGIGGEGGAGAGGEGGAADPDWFAGLSTDAIDGDKPSLRDWAKAAGVKDINGLAKIARDNQVALRESGRVKVPGEGATAEEITAWRTTIGVPETAEGYAIAPVKDANDQDVPLNTPLIQRLAAKAHEIGLPKAAFEGLVNDFIQSQLETVAGSDAQLKADGAAWAKEQGDKSAAKLAAVNRGAEALGLTNQEVLAIRAGIGAKRTLDALSKLGEGIGEDVLLDAGGRQRFLVSGDQAQADIDAMKADPIISKKITVKGSPENAKYNRLVAIAGEAANRKAAAGL